MLHHSPVLLVILSFITFTVAGPYRHYIPLSLNKRGCASQDPDADLRAQHAWLQDNEDGDNDLYNRTMIQDRVAQVYRHKARSSRTKDLEDPWAVVKRQTPQPLYTVNTWIHIVADSNNSSPGTQGYVTDKMVTDQIAYLNNVYSASGVAYNLVNFTRTTNDVWASNGDDRGMKTALRRGTYSTLNIYYQTKLQSNGDTNVPKGQTLLGFCSLPSAGVTTSSPPSVYAIDGCNILSGTLPGSFEQGYNLGGTTAHEVGHWNGLLHPFQDQTCDPKNWGDYVADTPQESTPTYGCPIGKDSCPTSGNAPGSYDGTTHPDPYGPSGYSGPDPIHNFMDYSQDSCYEGFTAGQSARMVNMWVIYRQGL